MARGRARRAAARRASRARSRRSSRRSAPAVIDRAASHRSHSRPRGRSRRARPQSRPPSQARLMPPWPPGKRSPAYVGRGHEDPERAAARDDPRVGACRRQDRRPGAQAGSAEGPRGAHRRDAPEPPMQAAYKPSAPKGVTDDYRCFLLDPQAGGRLVRDVGADRARSAEDRPPRDPLPRRRRRRSRTRRRSTAGDAGPGWSCFGGTGLPAGRRRAGSPTR